VLNGGRAGSHGRAIDGSVVEWLITAGAKVDGTSGIQLVICDSLSEQIDTAVSSRFSVRRAPFGTNRRAAARSNLLAINRLNQTTSNVRPV
jgi:hypothetical protein